MNAKLIAFMGAAFIFIGGACGKQEPKSACAVQALEAQSPYKNGRCQKNGNILAWNQCLAEVERRCEIDPEPTFIASNAVDEPEPERHLVAFRTRIEREPEVVEREQRLERDRKARLDRELQEHRAERKRRDAKAFEVLADECEQQNGPVWSASSSRDDLLNHWHAQRSFSGSVACPKPSKAFHAKWSTLATADIQSMMVACLDDGSEFTACEASVEPALAIERDKHAAERQAVEEKLAAERQALDSVCQKRHQIAAALETDMLDAGQRIDSVYVDGDECEILAINTWACSRLWVHNFAKKWKRLNRRIGFEKVECYAGRQGYWERLEARVR